VTNTLSHYKTALIGVVNSFK